MDFLRRWPTLPDLKASRPAAIKHFYHRHNVRRPEAVAQRLELISKALALTTDEAIVFVCITQVERLTEELRVIQKHVERYEQQIAQGFADHPNAPLFRELPGAGKYWIRDCWSLSARIGPGLPTPHNSIATAASRR